MQKLILDFTIALGTTLPVMAESIVLKAGHSANEARYALGILMGKVTSDLLTWGGSDIDVSPFGADRF